MFACQNILKLKDMHVTKYLRNMYSIFVIELQISEAPAFAK